MYVHSTNVYDNLPFDDVVRRDGRLYVVEVRAYLSGAAIERSGADFGLPRNDFPNIVKRLLETGPRALFPGERGVAFWRCLWDSFRLEERLRALDDREEAHVPPGLSWSHLDDLLAEAPDDVRFHISRGAAESFANTLPLLHPRGYLQVQDIFVEHDGRVPQRLQGPRQARRLARRVGERRAAARRRRPRRLRRALRARSRTVPARRRRSCTRRSATDHRGPFGPVTPGPS